MKNYDCIYFILYKNYYTNSINILFYKIITLYHIIILYHVFLKIIHKFTYK